jgi:hypothetical protein
VTGFGERQVRSLVIAHEERSAPQRAQLEAARRKTVAITPRRVDASELLSGKTAAIATTSKLVARIGGVARKGAAELPVATVRRDV